MNLNTVNYLRLPMDNNVACEQPAYCTSVLPGWDSSCKTTASCSAVMLSVDEGSVQEALSQYDKNHDHVLGPDDVADAPLLKKHGIESIDLIPTTTRRIAELFVAQQLLVGQNRFFASADNVLAFAKAIQVVNKAYDDAQWLRPIELKVQDGKARLPYEDWNEVKTHIGAPKIDGAFYAFNNLATIAALHFVRVNAVPNLKKDDAAEDPTVGKHYYRITPWGMPYGIQQQFIDTMRKFVAVNEFTQRVNGMQCVGDDCPEDDYYSFSNAIGVAILYQRDIHGLSALYDTTYGSGTLITARSNDSWAMIEVQGGDGVPKFEAFTSLKIMLTHEDAMNILRPQQESIF